VEEIPVPEKLKEEDYVGDPDLNVRITSVVRWLSSGL
jgi:hypothetical protein